MTKLRRLGATNLWVSPVGMGTCQLRMVPRGQAFAALRTACLAGVSVFHTSPDYEGALELTLEAISNETPRPLVLQQGYGPMPHFRLLYQQALATEPSGRLPLFGIGCVEDREAVGENVFGHGGMVEFLRNEKREGRLGGIFCTTHAGPAGMRRYLESGVFDAAMIAYNPLGFHLLTYFGKGQREFEDMQRIREEIFPLAQKLDIGLMVMKPLGGGLLAKGKAFPPVAEIRRDMPWTPRQILDWILEEPAVSCVIPGMASPEEVIENTSPVIGRMHPDGAFDEFRKSICSRCGACESSCSRNLPVSWLFRDGYIQLFPSETFESPPEYQWQRLHPDAVTACLECSNQSCECPQGIQIPAELPRLHSAWRDSRAALAEITWEAHPEIEVIEVRVPRHPSNAAATLHVRNRGSRIWQQAVGILSGGDSESFASLRHTVHPRETTFFAWDQAPPSGSISISWDNEPPFLLGRWEQ